MRVSLPGFELFELINPLRDREMRFSLPGFELFELINPLRDRAMRFSLPGFELINPLRDREMRVSLPEFELINPPRDREMSVSREDGRINLLRELKRASMIQSQEEIRVLQAVWGEVICNEKFRLDFTTEYSSSDTSYPARSEIDHNVSLDRFPQAHRSTYQWMKVGETAFGTSPSAGYANSNQLNKSPAEYSSGATYSQAWLALDGGAITNPTVCVDMVHGYGTATMNPLLPARRMTDQWMKVGETILGTSASAGYANSNRFNKSPAEYSSSATPSQAWFALDGGAIMNRVDMVHGDGTATMDPLLQAHPTTDQWMKVGETVLGTSPSAGYASSSSQAKFPFGCNASVCIDVGNNLNDIHGDGTATMDPIIQERLLTDHWVKLAEIVLAISATVVYSSSTHFPKFANAAGFIASLTAISLRSKWQTATRVLAKFGAIACAAGTLAAIGNDLPEEYKWIGTVAFLIPAVTVLFA